MDAGILDVGIILTLVTIGIGFFTSIIAVWRLNISQAKRFDSRFNYLLEKIDESRKENSTNIDKLGGRIDKLESRMVVVESEIVQLSGRMDRLEIKLDTVSGKVENIIGILSTRPWAEIPMPE